MQVCEIGSVWVLLGGGGPPERAQWRREAEAHAPRRSRAGEAASGLGVAGLSEGVEILERAPTLLLGADGGRAVVWGGGSESWLGVAAVRSGSVVAGRGRRFLGARLFVGRYRGAGGGASQAGGARGGGGGCEWGGGA